MPKCAGTSFRILLDQVYGSTAWYNYGVIFSRDQARMELVPPGTRLIHGHFIGDSFDDLFPERELITWVREPVERVVSNYFHFLRSPDMRDDTCRAVHEQKLGLRSFADLDWMQNLTSRYLAHKPVSAFKFIGTAERFEESMALYYRLFALPSLGLVPRVNTNPERQTDRYPIADDDRAYIAERNLADLAWYAEAQAWLDSHRSPAHPPAGQGHKQLGASRGPAGP